MIVSDRIADLRNYFPFSSGETTLRTKALSLGKCVKYSSGESVFLSGSPAKHCGLILEGQAVAFKIDSSGRRYQLCLEEGCFVGLETIREDGVYTAKIAAVTDLEILFWNRDGMALLFELDPDFEKSMRMLDDGRVYQEQWLVPESDITDPVLCSLPVHWLSVAAPVFLIVPLLLIGLGVCGMLIRRYLAAWLLVFALLAAGGRLLYRLCTSRANERVIITSKNLILIPKNDEKDMRVIRLSGLQSIAVRQNFFSRLISAGHIEFVDEVRQTETPLISNPARVAELIHDFSVRNALGRLIPLETDRRKAKTLPAPAQNDAAQKDVPSDMPEDIDADRLPPFRKAEFCAHWGLLLSLLSKPLLVFFTSLYAMHYFRNNTYVFTIRRILLAVAVAALIAAVYQFFIWRSHRFIIEEDCVKDYSRKPFSREDLNMAMIQKVQSVRYEKNGFLQVLFNYGTVYVLAGENELSFDYVGDPQRIQQMIMDTCARYETKRQMEEEARRRAYISDLVTEIQRENDSFSGNSGQTFSL